MRTLHKPKAHRVFPFIIILALIVLCLILPARAQTTQPAGSFELHEWTIFILDASQNRLNPSGFVTSSLPAFIDTRRQAAPADAQNDPCPVGVIRLIGQPDSKVDVRIEKTDGNFLACWPKAQTRSSQLLWRDLTLSDNPGPSIMQVVSAQNWFNSLRQSPSDYLSLEDQPCERFLLFDLDMPYPCPIKVKGGKDHSIVVNNVGNATLRDLRFYQGDHGTWRQAAAGDLAPSKPNHKPAATQTALNTTRPASTQAATQPAAIQLLPAAATRPSDIAADWLPALAKAGVSSSDAQIITKIITAHAFDAHRLTAVYLMDDAEYDRILPLEVIPEPSKIMRLGIVIIKNADPALGTEIDDLIVQLGDPAWSKREEAYKTIEKFGASAIPKLEEATKNKDLEIAWRAQKLVSELRAAPPQSGDED